MCVYSWTVSKDANSKKEKKNGHRGSHKRTKITAGASTGPAAEPSGRFPPPLLAGGGMGTPPVHWPAGGGDLYI